MGSESRSRRGPDPARTPTAANRRGSASTLWLVAALVSALGAGEARGWDCSALPQWSPIVSYRLGDQVQYLGNAYENRAKTTRRKLLTGD